MTVKLSISVPDDVAAYLHDQGDVSAAVTEAVRRILPDARRARQREAAQAFGAFIRRQDAKDLEDDRTLIESSNDISLRYSRW
jgi:hypothetical protein